MGVVAILAIALAMGANPPPFRQPVDDQGRFVNLEPTDGPDFGDFLKWRLNRKDTPDRAPVPRVEPDLARLAQPPEPGEGARITWLGHASFLVQLDGVSLLVDAALGEKVAGLISRNVPPGILVEKLPHIDAALVSHNHYDHLDLPTLKAVRAPVVAGLRIAKIIEKEGMLCTELGWWKSTRVGEVTITFVPSQHFSRRGLSDQNSTLWGGFVIQGRSATLYHSGDTAYFGGFKEIGRRFPGIDVAMLPIGAYDPEWFMQRAHVNPEQALQAFEDLGARTFVAMHWGTFKQTDEPLDEPPRRVEAERLRRGLPPERVRVLAIGETLEVSRPASTASPGDVAGLGGKAPAGQRLGTP